MSSPRTPVAPAVTTTLLFLLFSLGEQRFALPAREVVEVLPLLPLKPIPRAPGWVAGVFSYRGQVVPVIDLCHLALGSPARQRTSTRVVLVNYPGNHCLGLVLEQASQTLRCDLTEFKPYGLLSPDAPYLGPIREDAQGLLQRISVEDLLDERARTLLFAPENAALLGGASK
ncbi:chemotaxis protein CheW [Pseudomonas sp. DC3000-4b1]|uniref:chemotaxis protein CheW n=1 Tax=unclassified Pseudomonas TaxID=196821 RepID=UPI003CE88C7B